MRSTQRYTKPQAHFHTALNLVDIVLVGVCFCQLTVCHNLNTFD
jgi:hypothetical protein